VLAVAALAEASHQTLIILEVVAGPVRLRTQTT
jgi:hypothetical protein